MSFYVLKIYYTDGMNVGLQFIVNVLSKLQKKPIGNTAQRSLNDFVLNLLAYLAQSLCGVAYISILKGLKSHYPESPSKTIMVFCIKVNVAVENDSKNR